MNWASGTWRGRCGCKSPTKWSCRKLQDFFVVNQKEGCSFPSFVTKTTAILPLADNSSNRLLSSTSISKAASCMRTSRSSSVSSCSASIPKFILIKASSSFEDFTGWIPSLVLPHALGEIILSRRNGRVRRYRGHSCRNRCRRGSGRRRCGRRRHPAGRGGVHRGGWAADPPSHCRCTHRP